MGGNWRNDWGDGRRGGGGGGGGGVEGGGGEGESEGEGEECREKRTINMSIAQGQLYSSLDIAKVSSVNYWIFP